MSSIGRADEPATAPGARALPHLEEYEQFATNSGKRSPFHATRDFRMDLVIEAEGLRDAPASENRKKSI